MIKLKSLHQIWSLFQISSMLNFCKFLNFWVFLFLSYRTFPWSTSIKNHLKIMDVKFVFRVLIASLLIFFLKTIASSTYINFRTLKLEEIIFILPIFVIGFYWKLFSSGPISDVKKLCCFLQKILAYPFLFGSQHKTKKR